MELKELFTKNLKPAQKQYEAIRAIAFKEGAIELIAARFGYTPQSLKTLINRLRNGKHQLFPDVKRGPKERQTKPETMNLIVKLRRQKALNSREITNEHGFSWHEMHPNFHLVHWCFQIPSFFPMTHHEEVSPVKTNFLFPHIATGLF